ncbi:MAG: M15 family metallopeptidase [Bacteroidota bacterium]
MKRKLMAFVLGAGILCAGCGGPEAATPPKPDSLVQPVGPDPAPPPPPIDTVPPMSEYERTFIDSGLVEVQEFIPGIRVDLKYSTSDNFVSADVYGTLDRCYLRGEAAEKLKQAQALLQESHPGYSLLLYDCTRPHRVQQVMWDQLDIPYKRNYLAPPSEGSVHNYGCAVDLTLTDSTGTPLDMGTPFDFFGPLAQPQREAEMLRTGQLTETQHKNRLLLRRTMRQAGFYDIRTEWWHFNAFTNRTTKSRFTRIP